MKTHRVYIDVVVDELRRYLREDTKLLPEDVEDEVQRTRREVDIHLTAFRKEGLLMAREVEVLRRYAEGLLMAAQASWELDRC